MNGRGPGPNEGTSARRTGPPSQTGSQARFGHRERRHQRDGVSNDEIVSAM